MKVVLSPEHLAYAVSRGCEPGFQDKEPVFTVPPGDVRNGVDLTHDAGRMAWECRSAAGSLAGYHTRTPGTREFFWRQAPGAGYLPIVYAIPHDYQQLWDTGQVFLTEGIFDRVAVKACFPDMAVFARLSTGVSVQMVPLLKRYAKVVWLALDQDEEGQKAAVATEERLKGLMVVNLRFSAKDPSKFLELRGRAALRKVLDTQIGAAIL